MAKGDLKLLGTWGCPYAIRLRMVLEQKGLSYEYLEQDLLNKSELLLKHNPIHKKVPVLIHGDRSICESLVTLQYIDENWSRTGPLVLPADPYERAVACFWAAYVDDKLLPSFIGIEKTASEETKVEKISDTLAALEQLEGAFKKCSAGKSFFGGDTIGFLDVTLGSESAWIKAVEKISGVKLHDVLRAYTDKSTNQILCHKLIVLSSKNGFSSTMPITDRLMDKYLNFPQFWDLFVSLLM